MLEILIDDFQESGDKNIDALKQKLSKIRTGRASLALLDGIKVNYYGAPTPLKQVASMVTPEARLIVIQPWESSLCSEIEKAILKSDLGVTPNNDGKLIRIAIPPLTDERRRDLAKQVSKIGEEHKVALRQKRREANDEADALEKDKSITEDDLEKGKDKIQKALDTFIAQVDKAVAEKNAEIQEV